MHKTGWLIHVLQKGNVNDNEAKDKNIDYMYIDNGCGHAKPSLIACLP